MVFCLYFKANLCLHWSLVTTVSGIYHDWAKVCSIPYLSYPIQKGGEGMGRVRQHKGHDIWSMFQAGLHLYHHTTFFLMKMFALPISIAFGVLKIRSEINTNCVPRGYMGSKIFTNLYWGFKQTCHERSLVAAIVKVRIAWRFMLSSIRVTDTEQVCTLAKSEQSQNTHWLVSGKLCFCVSFSLPVVCCGKGGGSQSSLLRDAAAVLVGTLA